MLDFTISLILYNPNFLDLNKLFNSLALQANVSFELLIWDNSSQDHSKAISLSCNYRYFKSSQNLGFGRGHNGNYKLAKPSKYFLVINPDIYFEDPRLLKKILERMEEKPEIGLSSVRLLNPDGSDQDVHRLLPRVRDIAKRFIYKNLRIYDSASHNYTLSHIDKKNEFICPSISGAFMVIRSQLYKSLNGFDDNIFLYFEDIDLSRRCHHVTNGTNTVFGDLTVFHTWGRGGYRSFELFKIHILSTSYYFQKYGIFSDEYSGLANAAAIAHNRKKASHGQE